MVVMVVMVARWCPKRLGAAMAAMLVAASCAAAAMADVPVASTEAAADPKRIESLVEQLGSGEYWVREAAANELRSIGPTAIDALLSAAEGSGDLEVAMAARWLIDGIPLASADDSPEAAALLARYGKGTLSDSIAVMQRLLRLDDDSGIEPLARIARLDRSAAASRMAAALLVREWRPGEDFFPRLKGRILRGLGGSGRPTAAFVRSVVRFASGDAGGLEEAARSIERLRAGDADVRNTRPSVGRDRTAVEIAMLEDETIGIPAELQTFFDRTFVAMLVAGGRREEAVVEAGRLLAAHAAQPDDQLRGYRLASTLAWCGAIALAEPVEEALANHRTSIMAHPLSVYAAAMAIGKAGETARAGELADAAFHLAEENRRMHLDAASRIARWGCADWASREYDSLTTDPNVPDGEFALASIMVSEFLHDLGRDSEAAAVLRKLLENPGKNRPGSDELLRQAGRDPRSTRSRMFYFESGAAEARGDRDTRLAMLEQAIGGPAKDVDALIAAYHVPDAPQQRAGAVRLIREMLEQLESEIQADTDDPNPLNEYAWLVANTEGDVERAARYSKKSLEMSFDNPSYLDTLAHCQAAAGRIDMAVRTQSVAARYEPHNRTIQRNLERFRAAAAPPRGDHAP